MEKTGIKGIILLVLFVWAGMILGISFLEAPLKFQAPNVTLAIGLGIGRLVFGTLNKIEQLFGLVLLFLFFDKKSSKKILVFSGVVLLTLVLQSVWLLPELDARASIIIAGGVPTEKSPHFYYVAAEVIKLFSLIFIGLSYYNESIKVVHKA